MINWKKDYDEVQEFVDRLKSTNSTNDKIAIIKEYKDVYKIEKLLKYTYSPFKQFHVTSANLKKNKDIKKDGYQSASLFYLLDALSNRTITGHDAIGYVNSFVEAHPGCEELIHCVIDKNLKTRTGADLINKAIPGCVPTFKVALANSYDKQKGKVDFNKQTWFASQKLDGVRCLAVVD